MSKATYTIAKTLGLDESSGLDDTTLGIGIVVFVVIIIIGIGLIILMIMSGGKPEDSGADTTGIIEAIAASNQSKLPVTLNINTSPVYYPK